MNKPVLKDVLPLYTGVSHSYENDPGMVSWVKFGEMWVFFSEAENCSYL